MQKTTLIRWGLKPLVFLAALGPLAYLAWGAANDELGANPISEITLATGLWTLRFLAITLAVTPLRRLVWNDATRFRRMLGLFAFFYGSLHFLTYLWLDQFFDLAAMAADIWKRPFIAVGFAAFAAMAPLAVTSTAGWIRRLGGRTWQRLHRLVYVSAACGVLHFWWLVKADVREPLVYGLIVAALFAFRLVKAFSRRPVKPARTAAAAADFVRPS